MGPGDKNNLLSLGNELIYGLGHGQVGNLLIQHRFGLKIFPGNGIADDDKIWTMGQVLGIKS